MKSENAFLDALSRSTGRSDRGCSRASTRPASHLNSTRPDWLTTGSSRCRSTTKASSSRGGYRLDLLVERRVVLEIKAIDAIAAVHKAQLLSYLRFGDFRLGYLLNFNVALLRDGIARIANGLSASSAPPPRPPR